MHLSIFKVYTKQIRWYQTPFIFIFFCLIENLLTLGFGILYSFNYFEDQAQFWFSFILEVILINTIIFIDSQLRIILKILLFFIFLVLSTFFLLISKIADIDLIVREQVFNIVYSAGTIECSINAIIKKQFDLIPLYIIISITFYFQYYLLILFVFFLYISIQYNRNCWMHY